MSQAFITPKVARWARERVGFSHCQLADALGSDPQEVEAWERGETHPPFGKAQELAKTLKVPFGFLFLSDPPPDKTLIPDLRTVAEERQAERDLGLEMPSSRPRTSFASSRLVAVVGTVGRPGKNEDEARLIHCLRRRTRTCRRLRISLVLCGDR